MDRVTQVALVNGSARLESRGPGEVLIQDLFVGNSLPVLCLLSSSLQSIPITTDTVGA